MQFGLTSSAFWRCGFCGLGSGERDGNPERAIDMDAKKTTFGFTLQFEEHLSCSEKNLNVIIQQISTATSEDSSACFHGEMMSFNTVVKTQSRLPNLHPHPPVSITIIDVILYVLIIEMPSFLKLAVPRSVVLFLEHDSS